MTKEIKPRETEGYGEVRWDRHLINQDDEIVAQYDVLTMVAKGVRVLTSPHRRRR